MKNANVKQANFWAGVPKSPFESLSQWEGKTLNVTAVTEFVGTYSECWVLHGTDSDIPMFEGDGATHEVLVSKGYEGRDKICAMLQEFCRENPGLSVAVSVRKQKNFFVIEEPRN